MTINTNAPTEIPRQWLVRSRGHVQDPKYVGVFSDHYQNGKQNFKSSQRIHSTSVLNLFDEPPCWILRERDGKKKQTQQTTKEPNYW